MKNVHFNSQKKLFINIVIKSTHFESQFRIRLNHHTKKKQIGFLLLQNISGERK